MGFQSFDCNLRCGLARVALNSPFSCLRLPCVRITGVQHHTWPLQCCCGSLKNHVPFPCSASVPLSLGSGPTLCPCVHKHAFYTTVRGRLDPGLPDPWVNESIYRKMNMCPKVTCSTHAPGLRLELWRISILHSGCATEPEDTGAQLRGAGWPHQTGKPA